jgi:hypothetical protein
MTLFCYVHSQGSSTPYMEALDSLSVEQAKVRARRILLDHARSVHAEVFDGDCLVATLFRAETDGGQGEGRSA